MSEQTKSFIWNNQNLFSNNYLEHRLPETDLWGNQREKAEHVFGVIKKIYEVSKTLRLGPGEEAGLEDRFIRPVLKSLGYEWYVQPTTERGTRKKRPDYALFTDKSSLETARKEKSDLTRFFSYPITILEAKYWGRRLNDVDIKDTLDRRDPTAQTVKYLDDVYHASQSRIKWAILTNGGKWRLFYYHASSRSGNFFEIDLEKIILNGNIDAFLYFYLFFSRDAFIADPVTGKTWLDRHLKGSEDYAARVSEKLKELIFDHVFEGLASGFAHYRKTEIGITEETEKGRAEIFKGCLILLYRLLFLLYAESRNLLPLEDAGYRKVSLSKLREDICRDLSHAGMEGMSKRSYVYWARLEGLFNIIDKGDPALNVPVYNGGLFETPKHSFLTVHKLPDPFLAEAIEMLTAEQKGAYGQGAAAFIDYSSLNVRHLGDIYEGLLEFHVQIADVEIVEVKEKGKSIWKKMTEVKQDTKIYRSKAKGEVYIENSKHERKATGSYYTPHYIVEYIVKNTVGPMLDQKLETVKGLLKKLEDSVKALHRQKSTAAIKGYGDKIGELENSIFNATFDIKTLDPAMGSGHFLVHAVDFISDRIIAFLSEYPDNPVIKRIDTMRQEILKEVERQGVRIDESKLTEINLIKRTVMKRCIYGVDLNEMAVELAKLSLWLDSFTLGAPLSFLDHHLKCGNSLIGTNIEAIEKATAGQLFSINLEPLKRAIRDMLFVSGLSDATYQQVKESARKYGEANTGVEGYRILLDILISEYFGTKEAKRFLLEQGTRIDLKNLQKSLNSMSDKDRKVVEAIEGMAKAKRFFHWEVEFPEVFYTRVGELEQKVEKKESPGFDCVIGNPPYDVLSELEQEREVKFEKDYFSSAVIYAPTVGGKLNLYRLFSALSLGLLKDTGMHGFIVPMALLADKQAKPLREHILEKCCLKKIEALPQKDDPANRVFQEAKLSTCVYILGKENPLPFYIRIHPGKHILETSTTLLIEPSQIKELDKENLSIPSYPNMSKADFELALKLNNVSKGKILEYFASSQQGEVNLTTHLDFLTTENQGQIILRGAHINRYEFQEKPKQGTPMYLDVKKFLSVHGESTKAYDFRYARIGYQRGAAIDNWRRIIATIIEKENFCSDTINYIVNPKEYSLFAILALLNSSLWEWRFRLTSTNNHVNAYEIDSMPMPPISFTTPEDKRKKKVAKAIALYDGNPEQSNQVLKWLQQELVENRSDTVHDFLAYLAEQMIEINKVKNQETKGFLKWLEREVGATIEDLKNKSAIKEYHDHDFNNLLVILKDNKNQLSINSSDRKVQELIGKYFSKSIAVLQPLKTNIKATDDLIDQIVYRLYELTDEEIGIVRGGW